MNTNVSIGDRAIALDNEILRTVVGSGVHGMAIPGTDDHDEMGVYIERPEQVMGLMPTAEHYVSRTQPNGVRSGPGDTDLTLYSLRKFMRLATAGNPSILTLLYAPYDAQIINTQLGDELRALAPEVVSSKAGWRFLGYLDGQRQRMTGGGHQSRVPNRPELIEAHGYDTKYASHALRLGLQGLELMTTGRLTLPLTGTTLQSCMEVKRGEVGFSEALRRVDSVRDQLHSLMESTRHTQFPGVEVRLPGPNMPAINDWMIHAHDWHWNKRG